jgi:hypothetical protein
VTAWRGHLLTAARRAHRGAQELAIVDKSYDALGIKRITIFMGVDREIWQGIPAGGVQNSAAILRDHLHVAIKQHPVAGQWFVAVAQRVPAVMRLRILENRGDAKGRRIRLNADIGPLMEGPRVGCPPGRPALLANYLGGQLQCQTRKSCTRRAVVGTIYAVVLPDDCLHLTWTLTLGHLEVVIGNIDDG